MKILSHVIASGTGSAGGVTLTRSRGGLAFKARRGPANVKSNTQLTVRRILSQLSAFWTYNLTAANRTTWATYASTHPESDSLGQVKTLTGFQMFVRVNMPRVLAIGALSLNSSGPAGGPRIQAPYQTGTNTITGTTITLNLVFPSNLTTGDIIMLYSSRPVGAGRSAAHAPFALAQAHVVTVGESGVATITLSAADPWAGSRRASTPVRLRVYQVTTSNIGNDAFFALLSS